MVPLVWLILGPAISWDAFSIPGTLWFMLAGAVAPLGTQILLFASTLRVGIARASPLRNTFSRVCQSTGNWLSGRSVDFSRGRGNRFDRGRGQFAGDRQSGGGCRFSKALSLGGTGRRIGGGFFGPDAQIRADLDHKPSAGHLFSDDRQSDVLDGLSDYGKVQGDNNQPSRFEMVPPGGSRLSTGCVDQSAGPQHGGYSHRQSAGLHRAALYGLLEFLFLEAFGEGHSEARFGGAGHLPRWSPAQRFSLTTPPFTIGGTRARRLARIAGCTSRRGGDAS